MAIIHYAFASLYCIMINTRVVRSVHVQVRVSMLAQAILPLASSVIVNCKSKILLPLLTQLNRELRTQVSDTSKSAL